MGPNSILVAYMDPLAILSRDSFLYGCVGFCDVFARSLSKRGTLSSTHSGLSGVLVMSFFTCIEELPSCLVDVELVIV